MKSLSPYLIFQGNCEEVMKFYQKCLGGTLNIRRFSDTEMPVEDDYRNKIMHGELKTDHFSLMFSDGAPHKKVDYGNNIQLNIEFEDEAKATSVFNKLAEGGTITMPFNETFWNAKFGMLIDKFGICWMVNCSIEE